MFFQHLMLHRMVHSAAMNKIDPHRTNVRGGQRGHAQSQQGTGGDGHQWGPEVEGGEIKGLKWLEHV